MATYEVVIQEAHVSLPYNNSVHMFHFFPISLYQGYESGVLKRLGTEQGPERDSLSQSIWDPPKCKTVTHCKVGHSERAEKNLPETPWTYIQGPGAVP